VITDFPRTLTHAQLTMRVINRWADVVLFTGQRTARLYTRTESMPEHFLTYLPPVDIADFRPDPARRAAARAEFDFAPDDVVIGNIANVLWYKDHGTFIRAAAILKKSHPKTRFVILGATYPQYAEYTESLWREAEQLGLRFGVDLIQRDAGGRVSDLAQAFDLFWMTSASVETGPAAVEEAMALGLPVITTECGSVREMIEDGQSGFIVPIRDSDRIAAITARLLDAPDLRSGIGSQAREVAVRNFNLEDSAELHARAFRMAVQRRRRASGNSHSAQ
jgi:glycosyltransferase involved in cell wall biosynthesis